MKKAITINDLDSIRIEEETFICYRFKENGLQKWFYMSYLLSPEKLKERASLLFSELTKSGMEIIGIFASKKEAEECQEQDMLEYSKAYVPYAEQGINENKNRSFLVYIDDPNVVYPGYYCMFLHDYKILKPIMKIRLPTTDEIPNIKSESKVIFVYDLEPYRNLELMNTIFVENNLAIDKNSVLSACKLIFTRINTCRHIENEGFKIAVLESNLDKDEKTIETSKKLLEGYCKGINVDIEYANHLIQMIKEKYEKDPESFRYVKLHLPLVLMVNQKPVEFDYVDNGHIFYDKDITLKFRYD